MLSYLLVEWYSHSIGLFIPLWANTYDFTGYKARRDNVTNSSKSNNDDDNQQPTTNKQQPTAKNRQPKRQPRPTTTNKQQQRIATKKQQWTAVKRHRKTITTSEAEVAPQSPPANWVPPLPAEPTCSGRSQSSRSIRNLSHLSVFCEVQGGKVGSTLRSQEWTSCNLVHQWPPAAYGSPFHPSSPTFHEKFTSPTPNYSLMKGVIGFLNLNSSLLGHCCFARFLFHRLIRPANQKGRPTATASRAEHSETAPRTPLFLPRRLCCHCTTRNQATSWNWSLQATSCGVGYTAATAFHNQLWESHQKQVYYGPFIWSPTHNDKTMVRRRTASSSCCPEIKPKYYHAKCN